MNVDIKKFIPVIVLAIATVICAVVWTTFSSMQQQEESIVASQIDEKLIAMETAKMDKEKTASKTRSMSADETIVDEERVQTDVDLFNSVMQKLANWDSYESYSTVKKMADEQYGLDKDSSFAQYFYPEVEVSNDTNAIDANKYKLVYEQSNVWVTRIDTAGYHYFAQMRFSEGSETNGYDKTIYGCEFVTGNPGEITELDVFGLL